MQSVVRNSRRLQLKGTLRLLIAPVFSDSSSLHHFSSGVEVPQPNIVMHQLRCPQKRPRPESPPFLLPADGLTSRPSPKVPQTEVLRLTLEDRILSQFRILKVSFGAFTKVKTLHRGDLFPHSS